MASSIGRGKLVDQLLEDSEVDVANYVQVWMMVYGAELGVVSVVQCIRELCHHTEMRNCRCTKCVLWFNYPDEIDPQKNYIQSGEPVVISTSREGKSSHAYLNNAKAESQDTY